MSHTTKVSNVAIRDIDALEKAVKDLQEEGVRCELVKGVNPRMYYNDQAKRATNGKGCAYTLRLHDSKYDVGFVEERDKHGIFYSTIFDEWGDHIRRNIGVTDQKGSSSGLAIGNLMQKYTRYATINQASQAGWHFDSEYVDEKGNTQMVFSYT